MPYIKSHPFGYKPIKKKHESDHKYEPVTHVQVVNMGNGQIRVIKHYDPRPKRGRTFAEMVYESLPADAPLRYKKKK